MDRAERDAEIETLKSSFNAAQIALCADYRGMTVAKATQLRRELRAAGANVRVVKNTLVRIAAQRSISEVAPKSEFERFESMLDGPSMMIYSDSDPIGPTKILAKFAKDNEGFKLKGAWFEGKYVDSKGVDTLSKMPGREELLGMLLRLLGTPATQLVRLINAPAQQVMNVLDAQRGKLEAAA